MVERKDGEYTIQIRFSDTSEQKTLKQQTAAARLFRAAEFEAGCAQVGLSNRDPQFFAPGNEFEAYMQTNL
jgi:hypothetical protein